MKTSLKILLGAFIGALFLVSCKDQKGKSSNIGDMFEDKISVSMQGRLLAVVKNKEAKFYEFREKDSTNIEKVEVFKTTFSEDVDEIEFLFWSSTFVVRENQNLKFYRPTKDSLELLHTYNIPMEKINDIAVGGRAKILIREGLVVKHFQAEKDSLKFVKDIDLKMEEQINNVDEMTRLGEYLVFRNNNVLKIIIQETTEQKNIKDLVLPQEKIDEIFSNDSGLIGIRTGNNVKFYKVRKEKDSLNYLPQFDFEIK